MRTKIVLNNFKGLITYSEYLFLLCVITSKHKNKLATIFYVKNFLIKKKRAQIKI